jgi:hypothetical protein
MNSKRLFLAIGLMTAGTLNAQISKNFIKDYKAPDFQLRALSIGLNGTGYGQKSESLNSFKTYQSLSGSGTFSNIKNNSRYQGTARYNSGLGVRLFTDSSFAQPAFAFNLTSSQSHRWYQNSPFFIGVHDNSNLNFNSVFHQKDIDIDRHFLRYAFRPAFSVGIGRVEFTQFARQALDVELLLKMSGRLSTSFDEEDATQIANTLAQLRYKRGYDGRLLRIWQLEQLDSIVNKLDVVTKKDMRYMAFLSDAFITQTSGNRLSGSRIESGLVQEVSGTLNTISVNPFSHDYFSGAFVSLNRYRPTSYAFQHNLGVSALGGVSYSDFTFTVDDIHLWTSAYYSFGWYPNTRTSLEAWVTGNLLATESNDLSGDARIGANYRYYISPRTRLNVSASLSSNQDFQNHQFRNVPSATLGTGQFNGGYAFNVGLTHAIF